MKEMSVSMKLTIKGKAFTLVELLVVIAIIALLVSILLPALSKAKEQTILVKCKSNVRQIAKALRLYTHDNEEEVFWHDAGRVHKCLE